jgi:hypothetical protein
MWRRHHDENIVAEVTPVQGIGTWRACARRMSESHEAERGAFDLLVEAQLAADQLTHAKFGHVCDRRCGFWQPQAPQRRHDDA